MPSEVQAPRVVAVVVTFNRREMLLECLEALAAQTHPLHDVIVVDNASTDGTVEALRAAEVTTRLPVRLLEVDRNGGGAEGFHYGVRSALESESDWLWLMDDDCAPDPDALERLLASPRAAEERTTLLAPAVISRDRQLLPLNRGRVVSRWLFAPLVALSEADHEGGEAEIGFCTFVGPLIRTSAARAAGLPIAEMFIRNDDVEYCLRLGGPGHMWLVPSARIVHKDEQPFVGAESLAARAREFLEPAPLDKEWKHLYALRNLVFLARRHGVLGPAKALSYLLVQVARRLLLSERRGRAAYLAALYGADGMRGAFRSVVPADWPAVAHADDVRAALHGRALRYGRERAGVPERLGAAR